ncbi:50S ribosomal protein L4 [Candidatus Pacearchaeota archaeon]|nr:50S ribosomal protein L4 [Candidatus Pacearchaeota archaeon]
MTKANVFDSEGKKARQMELPKAFSGRIREDIVSKILEGKKIKQPYAPTPLAGHQHSAAGILSHRRHVWKSDRGKGLSRLPRKIMSRRGSQFNWEGATAPHARGGHRAHPPKILHMLNRIKVNKKEMNLALISALSATANKSRVSRKYARIEEKDIRELPFVIEGKILGLKTKELLNTIKNMLGEKLFQIATRKKSVRAGIGKLRGRKYKQSAGLLVVVGKKEKLKTSVFDSANANNLGVLDLAKGGLGRLVVYTEDAINELGEKYK